MYWQNLSSISLILSYNATTFLVFDCSVHFAKISLFFISICVISGFRSGVKGQAWTLMTGPTGCTETSVINDQSTMR